MKKIFAIVLSLSIVFAMLVLPVNSGEGSDAEKVAVTYIDGMTRAIRQSCEFDSSLHTVGSLSANEKKTLAVKIPTDKTDAELSKNNKSTAEIISDFNDFIDFKLQYNRMLNGHKEYKLGVRDYYSESFVDGVKINGDTAVAVRESNT